jgi:hypothetical protein
MLDNTISAEYLYTSHLASDGSKNTVFLALVFSLSTVSNVFTTVVHNTRWLLTFSSKTELCL